MLATSMIGVVTAMPAEAKAARPAAANGRATVVCGGVGPDRARAAARDLVDEGASGLVSFGIAGGLKPDYWPGIVVVARQVVTADGGAWDTDSLWRRRITAALIGDEAVVEGTVMGSDRLIPSRREKAALFDQTGAVAVDMESHAVAECAAEAGIPFLVLRAVADPAKRNVPGLLTQAIAAAGHVNRRRVVGTALTRPWLMPGLIRIGLDSRRGLAALRRVVTAVGPGFAGRPIG